MKIIYNSNDINNNRLLLSIIVPVYNVEKYLNNCLKSIVNQSLNKNNFEVILVDDKSTDNSLKICREYCKKYNNIHLIELEENTIGGAGIPSNIGIEYANGEYIGFVDSDDYIEPTMFQKMIYKAIKTRADVVICDFRVYYEYDKKEYPSYDQKEWKTLYNAYYTKSPVRQLKQKALALSPVPWRKIYRKEFLDKFNIRYPEGNFFYEDNPLHWFTIVQARTIEVINNDLIIHRLGRKGQTMDIHAENLLAFGIHGKNIINFLKSINKFKDYKIEYLNWLFQQNNWILQKLGKRRKQYKKIIKDIYTEISIYDKRQFYKIYNYKKLMKLYVWSIIYCHYYMSVCIKIIIKLQNKVFAYYKKYKNIIKNIIT